MDHAREVQQPPLPCVVVDVQTHRAAHRIERGVPGELEQLIRRLADQEPVHHVEQARGSTLGQVVPTAPGELALGSVYGEPGGVIVGVHALPLFLGQAGQEEVYLIHPRL